MRALFLQFFMIGMAFFLLAGGADDRALGADWAAAADDPRGGLVLAASAASRFKPQVPDTPLVERVQYGAPSSYWSHNGSMMYLTAQGNYRAFYYDQPRRGMRQACAQPGSLLFDGVKVGESYQGTARLFSCRCGVITYPVSGPVQRSGRRVVLYGSAPRRGRNCQITGYRNDTLVFDFVRRY